MKHALDYPFDAQFLLRKKKSLRRELLAGNDLLDKRVAILGGSTTAEIKDMLELFLLREGIRPAFHESEYGRYAEDSLYDNPALAAFAPDLVYVHTTVVNITRFPEPGDSPEDVAALLDAQAAQLQEICDSLERRYGCLVILNNFELPALRLLGNQDCVDHRGRTSFVARLNLRLAEYAATRTHLLLHDLNHLAARFGLDRWHDASFWFSYKYAMCYEAVPHLAHSLASMIKSALGRSRKCLVLDLDNTLWGGVIGDDGPDGIALGRETPQAEAYHACQRWLKDMQRRGVMLAVCSKNEQETARQGFAHPDSVLTLADISHFCANWQPKHENIRDLARRMNIGLDSLVFVDDNPAERAIVAAQLPQVAVPDLGLQVTDYPQLIDRSGLLETLGLSGDDLARNSYYADNTRRQAEESRFENYEDFLASLDMRAEIAPFSPVYLERIAQLTNKTNQFNLTTRRYTLAEIKAAAANSDMIHLYGRLRDVFGDNGLVSVVLAEVHGQRLEIVLWLMSCRVLKRGMELAMCDELLRLAWERGVREVTASYLKTAKNALVADHYRDLGFSLVRQDENGDSHWRLSLDAPPAPLNRIIKVNT